jgi:16S rRNA (adenine1518-N6/adenine1519-N6)-dimethyltransferase
MKRPSSKPSQKPYSKSPNHRLDKGKDKQGGDDRQTRWKFGQNFLVDESVIRAIVEDVPSNPSDWVIEIGPGQGALTRRLAPRCRKLTALEIDPKWVEHLNNHPEWGNLDVIEGDATQADWADIFTAHAPEPGQKALIVGNLPYNRAAPILLRLLPHLHNTLSLQIMVQFEVAKRLCASPHSRDFSFLTVMTQNWATAEMLLKVSPEAFRPRPKVASATLRLTPREAPICADPLFKPFVDLAFSQRRKMLSNVFESFYGKKKTMGELEDLGLRPDSRAEDLSVENFAALFARLGPVPGMLPSARGAVDEGDESEDPDSMEEAFEEET